MSYGFEFPAKLYERYSNDAVVNLIAENAALVEIDMQIEAAERNLELLRRRRSILVGSIERAMIRYFDEHPEADSDDRS